MRTYLRPMARAIDRAIEVLPTPGGPAKRRIFPFACADSRASFTSSFPAVFGAGAGVLADKRTTCLPKYMERGAFYATAWRLGRYYRTYPAYVQDEVTAALNDPGQFVRGPRTSKRGSASDDRHAFVVEDGPYLSARWPGDAYLFGRRFAEMLSGAATS